mmetsp:Transcript_3379/g.7733  ORF Transcript_3379/g.7733 Transcript_3379/m.7733 type:complete len:126 (+) Transcript_3379:94-471(+)
MYMQARGSRLLELRVEKDLLPADLMSRLLRLCTGLVRLSELRACDEIVDAVRGLPSLRHLGLLFSEAKYATPAFAENLFGSGAGAGAGLGLRSLQLRLLLRDTVGQTRFPGLPALLRCNATLTQL